MSFQEVRFPTDISRGSSGGPRRPVEVVTLRSGHEWRNAIWADSRRAYNAGIGLRDIDDLHQVLEFFEARRGKLYGFRWRDWSDYKSCPPNSRISPTDQELTVSDGSTTEIQLVKQYEDYVRQIKKPVEGSVSVAIDGELTDRFSIDTTTGILTLGSAPSANSRVTAGFEFDVPVRFDADQIDISVENFNAGEIPDISLLEIKV